MLRKILATALLTSMLAAPQRAAGQTYTRERNIQYIDRNDATPARLTSLDLYLPSRRRATEDDPNSKQLRPIVVFVHGGAWAIGDKSAVQYKPRLITTEGWILVSVNYRLSPAVQHPAHAEDVAAAVAWLRDNAADFGGDPDRIALLGHSAGAHLAAIVATDESLLDAHDLRPDQLAGVVLLDGAGYNIPPQMQDPQTQRFRRVMFETAFGDSPESWERASPTLHAREGGTFPPFLGIHVGDRKISLHETTELVEALKAAGGDAEIHHAVTKDHGGINRRLGAPRDADTEVVMQFLRRVFADSTGHEHE